jgi:hypothetical protein
MTTPARLPWDPEGSSLARRPTLDDFGGAVLADVDLMQPPFRTHWSAKRGNNLTLAAAAFCRTTFIAKFDVALIADTPLIKRIVVPAEYVNMSAFSLTAPSKPGNPSAVEITWTVGTLPPNEGYPVVTQVMSNEPSSPGAMVRVLRAFNITNGVRIEASMLDDNIGDAEFTVMVF